MMTTRFSGPVCVALAMFALPAAAQTPDGMTPAKETLCDPLADATPGLYGLCVAMCEAQDCKATLDPETGEVDFDESCNPSAERILENYNRKAGPSDPPMPCVEIACPCWSETAIDNIGGLWTRGKTTDTCMVGDANANLSGQSTDGGGTELAYAEDHRTKGLRCTSVTTNPYTFKEKPVSAKEYATCRQSVIDECTARGLLP